MLAPVLLVAVSFKLRMSVNSFDTDQLAEFLLSKGIPSDIVLDFTGKFLRCGLFWLGHH